MENLVCDVEPFSVEEERLSQLLLSSILDISTDALAQQRVYVQQRIDALEREQVTHMPPLIFSNCRFMIFVRQQRPASSICP